MRGRLVVALPAPDLAVAGFTMAGFTVASFTVVDFPLADFPVADFPVADLAARGFEFPARALPDVTLSSRRLP